MAIAVQELKKRHILVTIIQKV